MVLPALLKSVEATVTFQPPLSPVAVACQAATLACAVGRHQRVSVSPRVGGGVGVEGGGGRPGQAVVGGAGDEDVVVRADGAVQVLAGVPGGDPVAQAVGRHLRPLVSPRVGGGVGVEGYRGGPVGLNAARGAGSGPP